MNTLRNKLIDLPGEIYWRLYLQQFYKDFTMKIGLTHTDIDVVMNNLIERDCLLYNEYEINNVGIIIHALIEMKHWRESANRINDLRILPSPNGELAKEIPYFVVKYYPAVENDGYWEFSVIACNQSALNILSKPTQMSEFEYVNFLYRIRNDVPQNNNRSLVKHTLSWRPMTEDQYKKYMKQTQIQQCIDLLSKLQAEV